MDVFAIKKGQCIINAPLPVQAWTNKFLTTSFAICNRAYLLVVSGFESDACDMWTSSLVTDGLTDMLAADPKKWLAAHGP